MNVTTTLRQSKLEGVAALVSINHSGEPSHASRLTDRRSGSSRMWGDTPSNSATWTAGPQTFRASLCTLSRKTLASCDAVLLTSSTDRVGNNTTHPPPMSGRSSLSGTP
jgi:hypothetical protein